MKKITLILVLALLFAGTVKGQKVKILLRTSFALEYFKAGYTNEAIILTKKTLQKAAKRPGTDSPDYMYVLSILNSFYLQTNKIDEAGKTCEENYKNCEKHQYEYPQNFLMATQILATYYNLKGKIGAAEKVLTKLLETHSLDSYKKATTLSMLGKIAMKKGNYIKAEAYYLEVISIFSNSEPIWNLDYAAALNNLGTIYSILGFPSKSNTYYKKAIKLIEETDNKFLQPKLYVSVISNLAINYIENDRLSEAEGLLINNLDNVKSYDQRHILYVLGSLYLVKNKPILAKKYLQLSIDAYKNKDKDDTYYEAVNDMVLADIKLKKHISEKSLEKLKVSIKAVERRYGESNLSYIRMLGINAMLLMKMEKYSEAEEDFIKAIERTNAWIQRNMNFLNENEKFKLVQQFDYVFAHFQGFVLKMHLVSPSLTTKLFNYLVLRNKIILHNVIKTKHLIENSNDPMVKEWYDELQDEKYRLTNFKHLPYIAKKIYKKIDTLQKKIFRKVYGNSPANNITHIPNIEDLRSKLSDNEAIIQYSNFTINDTSAYYALVLTKNMTYPKIVYLCFGNSLKKALEKAPHIITADHITNIYKNENKLYKYLFKKIEPYLENITKINISPSGLVHNVAFACLKDEKNTYLKDKYQINYYNSYVDFTEKKDYFLNRKTTKSAVLFGDMQYDLTRNDLQNIHRINATRSMNMGFLFDKSIGKFPLNPLPATKAEVDSIADILDACKIRSILKYTGNEAIEERFYTLDNTPTDILHIATHGFYFPSKKQKKSNFFMPSFSRNSIDESYTRSGLFFAGASNTINKDKRMMQFADGILTAYEVKNMNLESIKLVVLSACLTGIGDIEQNEGIIGLSRAFKIAGVDNLIISLWSVPSYQTTEFMTDFYTNMSKGLSLDEAFRQTQQTMSEQYNNPYYWAGFVLMK